MQNNHHSDTTAQLQGLEDFVRSVMQEWRVRGVALAVVKNNVMGDIDTLIVPFEPTGNDIVFKRVPDTWMRERAFLEQFVGVYDLLEMQFVVFLKDEHTLSLSVPGQPDYELTPYKGNEFLAKGRSGMSVEFQRNASGTVTGIAVTMPDGVFRALKKG